MTLEEIRRELDKIYKERSKWDGARGPFTRKEIRKRELILIKQRVLYEIETAIITGEESDERFYIKIYELVEASLRSLGKS